MSRYWSYIVFILFSGFLLAQENDFNKPLTVTKYIDINCKNRWVNQQNYVVGFVKQNELWKKSFNTTAQVDSVISIIMNNWINETGVKEAIYCRFDAYPLRLISLLESFKGWEDHINKKYILPYFIEDVKFIKDNTLIPSVYLINVPSYMNLISITLRSDIDKDFWNNLYKSFNSVTTVIDSALVNKDFDKSLDKGFREIKSYLLKSKNRFELLDAIYNNDLNKAFAILHSSFSNGSIAKDYLVRPARMLFYKYNNTKQKEQAIATLNLLSQYTIEEELERDSIRSLCNKIDKYKGDSIFFSLQNVKNKSLFTTSKDKILLTGKYLDLTSSETIDLSKLRNKHVLFDFWFTSCGPCRKEIPSLIEFYSDNKSNNEFVFVSVVSDAVNKVGTTKKEIIKFIRENKIEYMVLYDTKNNSLTKKFDVKGFPTKFLINKDGYFLERNSGDKMASIEYAKAFVKELSEK